MFIRDKTSGAAVAADTVEREKYLLEKTRNARIRNLEKEVSDLKYQLAEINKTLTTLLAKME